ncbi:MAG: hypothetical protein JNM20_17145 [Rhizobiales bacterium]|nr:hypothetical protein [Hyphomicrobiales bacterium]
MIDSRYKKLTGMHAGHTYVVTGPANETDTPMTWSLRAETVPDERLQVKETELNDPKLWQPL